MKEFLHHFLKKPLNYLLLLLPITLTAQTLNWESAWIFGLASFSIIPLAGLIGEATEVLASHTGPRIGGLLNATLGNAAELIITLIAIKAGLLDLVKASITGSIIGNLLLVLGVSMIAGGIKNGIQKFNRRQAGNHSILLTLAVMALVIPSFFSSAIGIEDSIGVETLSIGVALVMVVLYVAGLIFSLRTDESPITFEPSSIEIKKPHWSLTTSTAVLIFATGGVVWMSEILVGSVESIVATLGLSEFFLGIILIPIIGNVAEHLVAVQVAIKNQMDLSMEIAISSSLQIALFVAPVLVFVSLLMGNPLTLIFNQFELIALGAAVIVAALVASDGESNWLEGMSLTAVYLILGFAFFLIPA